MPLAHKQGSQGQGRQTSLHGSSSSSAFIDFKKRMIKRLRILRYSKHFALSGWLIRYTHTNIASFFFVFVYVHIELYYSFYESPRVSVWPIGVLILGLNN